MTLDQVKSLVAERGIKFFLCSYVEMSGAPKAKLIPATHVEDMARRQRRICRFCRRRNGPKSA